MISCQSKKDTSRACQDGECQFPFISNYRYCKDQGHKKTPQNKCVPHKSQPGSICATSVAPKTRVMKTYGYCQEEEGEERVKARLDVELHSGQDFWKPYYDRKLLATSLTFKAGDEIFRGCYKLQWNDSVTNDLFPKLVEPAGRIYYAKEAVGKDKASANTRLIMGSRFGNADEIYRTWWLVSDSVTLHTVTGPFSTLEDSFYLSSGDVWYSGRKKNSLKLLEEKDDKSAKRGLGAVGSVDLKKKSDKKTSKEHEVVLKKKGVSLTLDSHTLGVLRKIKKGQSRVKKSRKKKMLLTTSKRLYLGGGIRSGITSGLRG